MLVHLSLRLRVFLFFCLLAMGGVAITVGGLLAGYLRMNQPALIDAYVFSGLIIVFLGLALTSGIWLLFDENVAKPIERLAAELRVRAHTDLKTAIDPTMAQYLGDLAPAANAIAGQLASDSKDVDARVATQTSDLAGERDWLTTILSELPIAMIVVNPSHQIVLYDTQAATILAEIGHPRLNASMFEYFATGPLERAYEVASKSGKTERVTLNCLDGAHSFAGVLKPLHDAPGYMIVIDNATAQLQPAKARPLIYDFDLLYRETKTDFHARPLSDLCFVVFDSETTGLLPHKDEVVQLGGVRILNGRLIEGEVFETLVDPGRPIPKSSTALHGVSDVMVRGAPDIIDAGRRFHSFCKNAVIVAHNAPFDMAFLRRHASKMQVQWDHPILDTVLLSAVLFGASAEHTLDALGQRFGISIPQANRHTALGDARATAAILCHMLPMLQARGLTTFGAVIDETRKHARLLQDLN